MLLKRQSLDTICSASIVDTQGVDEINTTNLEKTYVQFYQKMQEQRSQNIYQCTKKQQFQNQLKHKQANHYNQYIQQPITTIKRLQNQTISRLQREFIISTNNYSYLCTQQFTVIDDVVKLGGIAILNRVVQIL
ncbi:unnamed protein product (macronuclear) [Paramecium tetraurelia]|uniref:Uncharacterized protein n=1 Tax=Paramecium tetraurelia TaxID=5888 RepID=A0CAZ1_PARTE|nr:uncharacterized protein GSPATT00036741001 [Paramecium tetraurelia]CAK67958.1 unnamed protein product [Paramecium tetraurelia]|eukprot:XP_001435355.1 hypothetical protein (macronuclear) [Paramecium tetraurelia strain d4-2]